MGEHSFTCKCGAKSEVIDTWFLYYPCKEHRYMSAEEYSKWSFWKCPHNIKGCEKNCGSYGCYN